ncbi:MAG: GerMN domain-containing protein [Armatimonadota bacterium]
MAKRKRKQNNVLLIILFAVVVAGVAGGFYFFTKDKGNTVSAPVKKPELKAEEKPELKEFEVTIYLPDLSTNELILVPVTGTVKAEGGILDAAVARLLEIGTTNPQYAEFIPSGAKLLSPISVKNGIATLNFNSDFVENFSGGSDAESLLLNAIAHTVKKNSKESIKGMVIMVEDEPLDSLGHFDLSEPVVADGTLLKKGN